MFLYIQDINIYVFFVFDFYRHSGFFSGKVKVDHIALSVFVCESLTLIVLNMIL